MGIAKKLAIVLLIYLIAGFVVGYMLSTGMITTYWNPTVEYIALIFLPAIYLFNIFAPFIGLAPVVFGA
ncbi:MAG: hypothetical protein ACXAEF_01100 [Candidatus Thorarchaeota archaeon]